MQQLICCLNFENCLTMCRHENMPFNFDWHVKFGCYWKHFNRNVAGQKTPKREEFGTPFWHLRLKSFARLICWAFAGVRPASFCPARSPAKRAEQVGRKKHLFKNCYSHLQWRLAAIITRRSRFSSALPQNAQAGQPTGQMYTSSLKYVCLYARIELCTCIQ